MPRILAVDDNADSLVTLGAVLREALPGCTLLAASDGSLALQRAAAEDPDVVLLDIVMPGMDGYMVCALMKQDERLRDIPVVFLTALRTDRQSRIRALEAGGEAFLSKPLDEQELVAQVLAMAKIKAANRLRSLEKERLADLVEERTRELREELAERARTAEALQKALDDIRTLRGILPICANCKSIRDDLGYWKKVEAYLREHTEAEFSHGICPECMKKLYPGLEI
jgi:CheY-like chemotaxis protein